jgi:hypothetical protein
MKTEDVFNVCARAARAVGAVAVIMACLFVPWNSEPDSEPQGATRSYMAYRNYEEASWFESTFGLKKISYGYIWKQPTPGAQVSYFHLMATLGLIALSVAAITNVFEADDVWGETSEEKTEEPKP